ncbi:FMN-dependent dehydrogenase [Botryosphaeria dothidea]|uniref:FMN-dependent dehydrogenase n=1 Tax=Botryosphaeria dothidea TaxID=55169 RepID=A0A8H4IMT5_9PEZI|nr:FMN-dependent dehydrogenase [Botryosphaeria dothidea]
MRSFAFIAPLVGSSLAAYPWINEPDTGLERVLGVEGYEPPNICPELDQIQCAPDFEFAARSCLNASSYTWYRHASGGEWTYRNNLDSFQQLRFRPRMLRDVSNTKNTLSTSILGHNFSAPFFIAPAARAAYSNPEEAEIAFMKAAYAQDILYMPALYASKTIEELAAAKPSNGSQVTFQQLYTTVNDSSVKYNIKRAEAAGAKAIVFTIDAVADGDRTRDARYRPRDAQATDTDELQPLTWNYYTEKLTKWTDLPVILKGIYTVEDAKKAVEVGAPAIYISNHGGRQLDGAPSPLEIAIEIHEQAPEVFEKLEVYADSGVRYGTDILKLLALGVRAVGLGRPFHYANVYGQPGVERLIELLKQEIVNDAGNLGLSNLWDINADYLNLDKLKCNGW